MPGNSRFEGLYLARASGIGTDSRFEQRLYFVAFLRHYFFYFQMNPVPTRGVLLIYKESRAETARLNQTVQELVLTHPGRQLHDAARNAVKRADVVMCSQYEWESLLAENAPLAFRVARGVLRNDADAEDVAQEALFRAHRQFERLRDRARFRAWLVRISFRIALDRLRATKRRRQREAQWVFESARSAPRTGENAEFQRQFDRALEDLPEKQRLVLLLAAMEGHTIDEVSVLLGIPVGTVKSRLFFARKTLAEKLRCFVNSTANR